MAPHRRSRPGWEICVVLLACGLVSGCDMSPSRLSSAAETARMRTEHLNDDLIAKSNAREAKIFADAAAMRRTREEIVEGPRYEVRKDGSSSTYLIYDNRTGSVARIGTQTQIGLTAAEANGVIAKMQDMDDPSPYYPK
jgi:hypothetical protein